MADHAKPTTTSHYADFVNELNGRLQDLARGLDPATSSPTNLPSGAIRWSSAAKTWQAWNGAAWSSLSSGYAISITGNAATATKLATARRINGQLFDGSSDITLIDPTAQPADDDLTALAVLTGEGLIKRTGAGSASVVPVTPAGEALLAGANAGAQRTALGLGSAAQAGIGTGDADVPTNAQLRSHYGIRKALPVNPTIALNFVAQTYRANLGANGLETLALLSVLTMSRASKAWRTNALGVIEEVAAGVPRLDFDPVTLECRGLLVEGQRTRLNTISLAPTAPENIVVTAQPYTLSFYGTGTVTLAGAYVATVAGGGAYPTRTRLTFTPAAGTLTMTYAGSCADVQLEEGSMASSVIRGEGTQVTRAADIPKISRPSTINVAEGTLAVEVQLASAVTRDAVAASVSDGSTNNVVIARAIGSGGATTAVVRSGGSLSAGFTSAVAVTTVARRLLVSYRSADFSFNVDGALQTATSGAAPVALNEVTLGCASDGTQQLFGWVRGFNLFPKRLSDSDGGAWAAA